MSPAAMDGVEYRVFLSCRISDGGAFPRLYRRLYFCRVVGGVGFSAAGSVGGRPAARVSPGGDFCVGVCRRVRAGYFEEDFFVIFGARIAPGAMQGRG